MEQVKILVADDDELVREELAEKLEEKGWEVIHAINGREALKKWTENNPDLIILDMDMPGYTGVEVLEVIRAKNRQTPVIIYSALGEEAQIIEGLIKGGNVYLVKAYKASAVAAQVEKYLRKTEEVISLGKDIVYDIENHCLRVGDRVIQMSLKQGKVFTMLCRNKNELTRRKLLLQAGWDGDESSYSLQLNKMIGELRRLIKPVTTLTIETDTGNGYWLKVKE